jgi:hypothetical protein
MEMTLLTVDGPSATNEAPRARGPVLFSEGRFP